MKIGCQLWLSMLVLTPGTSGVGVRPLHLYFGFSAVDVSSAAQWPHRVVLITVTTFTFWFWVYVDNWDAAGAQKWLLPPLLLASVPPCCLVLWKLLASCVPSSPHRLSPGQYHFWVLQNYNEEFSKMIFFFLCYPSKPGPGLQRSPSAPVEVPALKSSRFICFFICY